MTTAVDYNDVQGLVRFGYRRMTDACYLLVSIKSAAAAKAWLRAAPVTSAATQSPPPPTALQIAMTADGLIALGVAPAVVAGFSPEFLSGMTEASRVRRLGDVGQNAPGRWTWGYATRPHVLVMFFAEPGQLDALVARATASTDWNMAFTVLQRLGTQDIGEIEPFGFADGLSQPAIDWEQHRDLGPDQIDYTNLSALGEFILGYRNEYDKYTDRPVVDATTHTSGLLPAEDAPGKKDVARNGTYLVFRQLRQDVRGFWQFLYRQSGNDAAAAETLAELMVGRKRAGEPLAAMSARAIPGIEPDRTRLNQFTFDEDPMGTRCPLGAHVRRANPRNADYPGRPGLVARLVAKLGFGPHGFRDDMSSAVRFHRVLRRGREYGPPLSPGDALSPAPPDDAERGLHFICLNANISRQFEFLQNAWMISTQFAGSIGESDPLMGTRTPLVGCPVVDDFNIQTRDGVRRRVSGLPQFVTVLGGAYFFLPGLRALRYFAGAETTE